MCIRDRYQELHLKGPSRYDVSWTWHAKVILTIDLPLPPKVSRSEQELEKLPWWNDTHELACLHFWEYVRCNRQWFPSFLEVHCGWACLLSRFRITSKEIRPVHSVGTFDGFSLQLWDDFPVFGIKQSNFDGIPDMVHANGKLQRWLWISPQHFWTFSYNKKPRVVDAVNCELEATRSDATACYIMSKNAFWKIEDF